MNRRILYIASAVAILAFALCLLGVPVQFMGFYGETLGEGGAWLARIMASIQLANVFLLWRLRNLSDSFEARTVSTAFVISWGLTAVMCLLSSALGVFNALGWGTFALSALLTVGFAIDAFSKRD